MVVPILASAAASKGAQTVVQTVKTALQTDIAVIRSQTRPRGKRKQPIDYELHVNGAGILLTGAAAVLIGWYLNGMKLPGTPSGQDPVLTAFFGPAGATVLGKIGSSLHGPYWEAGQGERAPGTYGAI